MFGIQKTGWRLKQLLSHRRKPSLDNSGNGLEEFYFTDSKLSTNAPKRLSWLSQSPSTEIPLPLRRTSSSATARTHYLPLGSTTAHSSASSLCSCDCDANPAAVQQPLSKSDQPPSQPAILYLPPVSPTNSSGDAKTWRLIFSEHLPRSPASTVKQFRAKPPPTIAAGSTFDLIEALALDPIDNDRTPTQSLRYSEDSGMEDFSDNVQQLIKETDEAFRAVGTARRSA